MLRYIACHLDGYDLESEGVSTAVFTSKQEQLSKKPTASDLRTSKQSQGENASSLEAKKKMNDEESATM